MWRSQLAGFESNSQLIQNCGDIPLAQPDILTPYLRAIFTTIGINQVEFLRLEGLSRGPDAVARALDQAASWMEQHFGD